MIYTYRGLNFGNVAQSFQYIAFGHIWDTPVSATAFKSDWVPLHTLFVKNVHATASAFLGAVDASGFASLGSGGWELLPGEEIQMELSATQVCFASADAETDGTLDYMIVTK